jgi:hypothetical protein
MQKFTMITVRSKAIMQLLVEVPVVYRESAWRVNQAKKDYNPKI